MSGGLIMTRKEYHATITSSCCIGQTVTEGRVWKGHLHPKHLLSVLASRVTQ